MDAFDILDRCRDGQTLSVDEIEILLRCDLEGFDRELSSTAARVRDAHRGKGLFMYGFVYFSTFCRNDCSFCYYRKSNPIGRYRKSRDEVIRLSEDLRDAGVNMVDLTTGEDPVFQKDGCSNLVGLVEGVRDRVDIGIMVSPGAVPKGTMADLRKAGADWFACYQETYNRDVFGKMRIDQDYQNRIDQRLWARDAGLLTEDGMLVGIGETAKDRAEQIRTMGEMGCRQMRAMTFVPQAGTPMQNIVPRDNTDELRAISVMRLAYPDVLIPASLDVEGISGLKARIDAGADVITSIVPPHEELAGVAQPDLDINDGHRSVDHVKRMVAGMGRHISSDKEFRDFMESRRPEAVL
ncbi:MAG: methylornithine synthase PylB [archaeon]|nr:methylornithine synthase PylB [archaeon]